MAKITNCHPIDEWGDPYLQEVHQRVAGGCKTYISLVPGVFNDYLPPKCNSRTITLVRPRKHARVPSSQPGRSHLSVYSCFLYGSWQL